MKRFIFFISQILPLLLVPAFVFSQTASEEIEMADLMRSSGKIYVVVAVLLIIFIGLAAYLINIDKKVSRLERDKNRK